MTDEGPQGLMFARYWCYRDGEECAEQSRGSEEKSEWISRKVNGI